MVVPAPTWASLEGVGADKRGAQSPGQFRQVPASPIASRCDVTGGSNHWTQAGRLLCAP